SAFTLVAVIALVGGLLTLAGRSIIAGFSDLADQAVQGFDQLLRWLSDGPLGIEQEQLEGWLDEAVGQVEANAGSLASGALAATTTVTEFVLGAVIAIFCLFFFL